MTCPVKDLRVACHSVLTVGGESVTVRISKMLVWCALQVSKYCRFITAVTGCHSSTVFRWVFANFLTIFQYSFYYGGL